VSFFTGSVAGLQEGAPVTFRGVRVGNVTSVGIRLNPETYGSIIQINMEILPGAVTFFGTPLPRDERLLPRLVERGLTAKLIKQTLVTGQLSVELDFRPNTEAVRLGESAGAPEIPSVPSDIEAIAKKLEEIDVGAALESAQRTVASLERILAAPELAQTIREVPALVVQLRLTLKTIDREAASASTATRSTLERANAALDGANTFLDPRGRTAVQVQRAADDLAATAARLRALTERVDRDPASLLRGR
jgi:paraquat-inducible protein B